jgi:uncharacterized delta-60 repeat protein
MVFSPARIATSLHVLAIVAAYLLLTAGTALAGPVGEIDTTFNGGGILLQDLAPAGTNADEGLATAVQPDGKIVVAGTVFNGSTNVLAVARFKPDGTLDTGFGTGGLFTQGFGSGAGNAKATGVAISKTGPTAGRIYAVGYGLWGGAGDIVTVALTSSGALDTSFGTLGYLTHNFSGDDRAAAVAVDSGGRVVVAGTTSGTGGGDIALIRYTDSGAYDTSFDSDGYETLDYSGGLADTLGGIAVDPSDRILLAGSMTSSGTTDFLVARLTTSGVKDSAFGTGGSFQTSIGATGDDAAALTLDGSGRVIAVGAAYGLGGPSDFSIVRLGPNGAPDLTWGPAGAKTMNLGGTSGDYATGVAVDADGRIVVGGWTTLNVQKGVAVVRYNADGTIDNTWSGDGQVVSQNPLASQEAYGSALALSGGRDVVMVGGGTVSGELQTLVVRYEGDPAAAGVTTLDLTGCTSASLTLPNVWPGQIVKTPSDCTIQFGNSGSSSMLLMYQSDGTGTAMNGPVAVPDYVSGSADWTALGTSAFGACLRDGFGGGFAPAWAVSPGLTCATDNTQPWQGIRPTSGTAGAKVASAQTANSLVTAKVVFAFRTGNLQPSGAYTAPITFEVVSPDA